MHYSRVKHIDIKHHFIRDHVESGDFLLTFVDSENQLANIFTNPYKKKDFVTLEKDLVFLVLIIFKPYLEFAAIFTT